MRALRIPLPAEVPTGQPAVPVWIIDGERAGVDDRREAPRLEIPRLETPRVPPRAPRHDEDTRAEPLPGSTVIVIPL